MHLLLFYKAENGNELPFSKRITKTTFSEIDMMKARIVA